MATYNVNVVRAYRAYVQTDKGPCWFTVNEIDTPIIYHADNRYRVPIGQLKYVLGNTIFAKRIYVPQEFIDNQIVSVDCTTLDGLLTCGASTYVQSGTHRWEAHIRWRETEQSSWSGIWETSGSGTVGSNETQYMYTGHILLGAKDQNGVRNATFFDPTGGIWTDPGSGTPVYLYPSGANSLGNIYLGTTNSAVEEIRTIFNYRMDAANYVMGIAREYVDPYEDEEYTPSDGDTDPPDGEHSLPQDELAIGGSPYNDMRAGLFRAYAMTESQVNAFSNQLWNTDVLDSLSRWIQNPTDIVLNFMSFPFDVDSESTSEQIGFNWCNAWGLSSIVATGYKIWDGHLQHLQFGKIEIPNYSGTFYDYGPYSSVMLHLPYIGFVPLKMNECVGRNIYVDYWVDVITGDFTAEVTSDGYGLVENKFAYGTPKLGMYQGNIGRPLPLTQQSVWQIYKKIGETAVAAIVAGAGAGLGAAAMDEAERYGAMASDSDRNMLIGGEPLGQTPLQMHDQLKATASHHYKTAKRAGVAGVANAIINMQSVNGPIVRNGSIDGSNGRTSSQECFVIIAVPDQSVPDNQRILGYPSNIPGPLSKVSGYTEVREIQLHSSVANNNELAEIEEIVRGGIII